VDKKCRFLTCVLAQPSRSSASTASEEEVSIAILGAQCFEQGSREPPPLISYAVADIIIIIIIVILAVLIIVVTAVAAAAAARLSLLLLLLLLVHRRQRCAWQRCLSEQSSVPHRERDHRLQLLLLQRLLVQRRQPVRCQARPFLRQVRPHLQKRHTVFFECCFSLCVSRACLGKMMAFLVKKWRTKKKDAFPHRWKVRGRTKVLRHRDRVGQVKNRVPPARNASSLFF
jgi:hypothetical protein